MFVTNTSIYHNANMCLQAQLHPLRAIYFLGIGVIQCEINHLCTFWHPHLVLEGSKTMDTCDFGHFVNVMVDVDIILTVAKLL